MVTQTKLYEKTLHANFKGKILNFSERLIQNFFKRERERKRVFLKVENNY